MLVYSPLIMTERKCSVGDTLSLIYYIITEIACTYVKKKKRLVTAITSLILFATKESVFR